HVAADRGRREVLRRVDRRRAGDGPGDGDAADRPGDVDQAGEVAGHVEVRQVAAEEDALVGAEAVRGSQRGQAAVASQEHARRPRRVDAELVNARATAQDALLEVCQQVTRGAEGQLRLAEVKVHVGALDDRVGRARAADQRVVAAAAGDGVVAGRRAVGGE